MSIKADRGKANDGLSSALLVVFLDSARNLPVSPAAPEHTTASTHTLLVLHTLTLLNRCAFTSFICRHGNA